MITTQALRASTQALRDAELRPWQTTAAKLVAARLRDARAHAEAGRMFDASSRLDELTRSLSDDVLDPARTQFYRRAFEHQGDELDPELVDPSVGPTPNGAAAARRAPIRGQDQRVALAAFVAQAGDELKLATSISRVDGAARIAYHESWERRHRDTITAAVQTALSDSQTQLFHAVGQVMMRPDVR